MTINLKDILINYNYNAIIEIIFKKSYLKI